MAAYDFGPYHPLRPERIDSGFDLLTAAGLWSPDRELVHPDSASLGELTLVHAPEYVDAVRRAGSGDLPEQIHAQFGLSSRDNPPFPDMHNAAALVAGGTVRAVRDVMDGRLDRSFVPAGGLHHAHHARASGFCIYNDPAIAAAVALKEYGARVMYVDLDCHHGDGVQWIFYSEPNVLTVSFHESGRYLFPATGFVEEIGEGAGAGMSVNVPFMRFTRDGSWMDALALLEPLAARFQPDLLISNHGCDTHVWDPLTHLELSTASLHAGARVAQDIAERYAGGRWVALGSGGYDWVRVVPRSWAILWTEMTGRVLPDRLPAEWVDRWRPYADGDMPGSFLDAPEIVPGRIDPQWQRHNADTLRRVAHIHGLDETLKHRSAYISATASGGPDV